VQRKVEPILGTPTPRDQARAQALHAPAPGEEAPGAGAHGQLTLCVPVRPPEALCLLRGLPCGLHQQGHPRGMRLADPVLGPAPPALPASARAPPGLAAPWGATLSVDCAALVALVCRGFYARLEPKAGSMAAGLLTGCFLGSHALLQLLGAATAWKVRAAE